MPFLFLIAGTVMIVSSVRGTQHDLIALLKSDFTGRNNFVYWMTAILIIGAIGYIPNLKPLSRAFMALVVIVLFLNNHGVFQNFVNAIGQTQTTGTPNNVIPFKTPNIA